LSILSLLFQQRRLARFFSRYFSIGFVGPTQRFSSVRLDLDLSATAPSAFFGPVAQKRSKLIGH